MNTLRRLAVLLAVCSLPSFAHSRPETGHWKLSLGRTLLLLEGRVFQTTETRYEGRVLKIRGEAARDAFLHLWTVYTEGKENHRLLESGRGRFFVLGRGAACEGHPDHEIECSLILNENGTTAAAGRRERGRFTVTNTSFAPSTLSPQAAQLNLELIQQHFPHALPFPAAPK